MSKFSGYTAAGVIAPTDLVVVDTSTGSNTRKATIPQINGVVAQSGVAVTHTGDTSEFTLATVAVPGNTLGANGQLEIRALLSKVGTAGSATWRIKFGGTTFHASSPSASTLCYEVRLRIANQNATNAQVGVGSAVSSGIGTGTGAKVTAAIDTTASQNILITGQNGSSGDTIAIESFQVLAYPYS